VASFEQIMASQPTMFQNTTLANLMSSAQVIGGAFSLYQSVSNLGSGGSGAWGGQAQMAQAGQAGNVFSSGQQLLGTLGQTQMAINMGAQQMQMAKMRLTQMVAQARTEGFIVMTGGTVTLAPWMYDANPGRVAAYKARAAMFNAQIQAVVFQTTAADIAVGLSLAKTGVDILNAFIKKDSGAGATTVAPGGSLTPGTLPIQPGIGTTPGIGMPGIGTGLASPGQLGLGPYPGMGGVGGLGPGLTGAPGTYGVPMGGPGSMTGIPGGPGSGVYGVGAPGLAGGGRAGAGGAGVPGGRGMAGGGNTVVGMGGAPVGASGAGKEEEREATGWLLAEDEEVFAPGDLPDSTDGVLS